MKITRPLQNPTAADLVRPVEMEQITLATTPEIATPDQIPLIAEDDLQDKVSNRIADLWAKAKRRELEIELMPFWKNLAAPFAIVTSVLTVLGLFFGGLIFFNRLAPTIPFYFNALENRWEEVDKSVLLFLPIGLFILESIAIKLIYDIFYYDRRLSLMLSWILGMVNLLIIIAAIEIYTLSIKI